MKHSLKLNIDKFNDLLRESGAKDGEMARKLGISSEQLWKIKNQISGIGADFVAGCMIAFPSADLKDLFFVESNLHACRKEVKKVGA